MNDIDPCLLLVRPSLDKKRGVAAGVSVGHQAANCPKAGTPTW